MDSVNKPLAVEHPTVRDMTPEERLQAVDRVSLQNREQLIQWLKGSGREWLIFDSGHLVKALSWPMGTEALMEIVYHYTAYRRGLPTTSGKMVEEYNPKTQKKEMVPAMMTDSLELVELDRLIRYLMGQATELDSTWSLDNEPL